MKMILIAILPAALMMLFAFPSLYLARRTYLVGNKERRSPISGMLLRSPGQSLLPQLDELAADIYSEVFGIFVTPIVMLSVAWADWCSRGHLQNWSLWVILLLVTAIVVLWSARKLVTHFRRLGL